MDASPKGDGSVVTRNYEALPRSCCAAILHIHIWRTGRLEHFPKTGISKSRARPLFRLYLSCSVFRRSVQPCEIVNTLCVYFHEFSIGARWNACWCVKVEDFRCASHCAPRLERCYFAWPQQQLCSGSPRLSFCVFCVCVCPRWGPTAVVFDNPTATHRWKITNKPTWTWLSYPDRD